MSDEDCLIGDDAIHGESAYTFGDETDVSTLHGKSERDLEKAVNVVEAGDLVGEGSKSVKQS